MANKIPVIYTSERNMELGYVWKVIMNETAKIPAFCNRFPELNHNEMEGFDMVSSTQALSEKFATILLVDSHDDVRIIKRMNVLRDLYREKNIPVHEVVLNIESSWHTVAHAVELGDAVSQLVAKAYGVSPEEVPLVEDFKKRIA